MIKRKVQEMLNLAEKLHRGQMRDYSGLPYIVHPKGVARIVEELTGDEELVVESLGHDLLEDTTITVNELARLFGDKVAGVIWHLTVDDKTPKKDQIQNVLLTCIYKEVIIKLADRYHNVLYLNKDIQSKQHLKFIKHYYTKTREIFTEDVQNYLDTNEFEYYTDAIRLLKSMIMNQLEYLKIQFNFD